MDVIVTAIDDIIIFLIASQLTYSIFTCYLEVAGSVPGKFTFINYWILEYKFQSNSIVLISKIVYVHLLCIGEPIESKYLSALLWVRIDKSATNQRCNPIA